MKLTMTFLATVSAGAVALAACEGDSSTSDDKGSTTTTTTGPGGGGSGANGGNGGDTGGSAGSPSQGGAGGGTGGEGGSCVQITNDPSAIGDDCSQGNPQCPAGYTCWGIRGIVFQELCEILCEESCECPDGYACVEMSDKAQTWTQCGAM
jgi:hypothetical protein